MKKRLNGKKIVGTTPTGSKNAHPSSGLQTEVLDSAKKKYCFIQDISFNDLDDQSELETGSICREKVSQVLADSSYSTRSTRCQTNSAQNVFLKRDRGDAVKLMGTEMAPGAHGHVFCLSLVFYCCNSSFRAAKKKLGDVEGNLDGRKEKVLEEFEVEDEALLHIKHLSVFNPEPRRRDLFHALVLDTGIYIWTKERRGTRCFKWMTTMPLKHCLWGTGMDECDDEYPASATRRSSVQK